MSKIHKLDLECLAAGLIREARCFEKYGELHPDWHEALVMEFLSWWGAIPVKCRGTCVQTYKLKEALSSDKADEWRQAIDLEREQFRDLDCYDEVPYSEMPEGHKAIPLKPSDRLIKYMP